MIANSFRYKFIAMLLVTTSSFGFAQPPERSLRYILDHFEDGWVQILQNRFPTEKNSRWQTLLSFTSLPHDVVDMINEAPEPAFALLRHLIATPSEPLSDLGVFLTALGNMGLHQELIIVNARRYLQGITPLPAPRPLDGPSVLGILNNFNTWRTFLNERVGDEPRWKRLLEQTSETFPRWWVYNSLNPARRLLSILAVNPQEGLSRRDQFLLALSNLGLSGPDFESAMMVSESEIPMPLQGPSIEFIFENKLLDEVIQILNESFEKWRRWEIILDQISCGFPKFIVRASEDPARALLDHLYRFDGAFKEPLQNLDYFLTELKFLGADTRSIRGRMARFANVEPTLSMLPCPFEAFVRFGSAL